MSRKIHIKEKREWLDMYEQGKTEAQIARLKRRDLRTIVKGIKEVTKERRLASAEAELLRNALFTHQEHLANILKNINSMLVAPPHNLELRKEKESLLAPIHLPYLTVKQTSKDEIAIVFDDENKLEWELLQEHLKEEKLWYILKIWRELMGDYFRARLRFKQWIESQCNKRITKSVADQQDNKNTDGFLSKIAMRIHDSAIARILDVSDKADSIAIHEREAITIFTESQYTEEAEIIKLFHEALTKVTTSAKREVEELLLLGMITGKCRVCLRLGK